MKSRASYFNVSPALVLENLRRFWTIGILGFLVYFLSGPLPILMNYNELTNMYSYIISSLENVQPFFLAAHVFIPLVAAIVLFRYLHNTASTTTIHSMPFTRSELFVSNTVSGIILVTMPILLNGVIYHIIQKPVYAHHMYKDYDPTSELLPNAQNLFTHSAINNWIFESLLLVGVVFVLSILAGMITGNLFLHLLVAVGLNVLAIAFYGSMMAYFNSFFYGYTAQGAHTSILLTLNPFAKLIDKEGGFPANVIVIYVGLIVVCSLFSWLLYKKRAMEKASEGIVFKFVIPILNYILAYFGMTLMGYYFAAVLAPSTEYDFGINMPFFCTGLVLGALLAFVIARMILLGTPRIFNLDSLKSLGVYAVIATLFICGIYFDITGFESKVPNSNDIKGIQLYVTDMFKEESLFNTYCFGKNIDIYEGLSERDYSDSHFVFKDEKNIEAVRALHAELTKGEEKFNKFRRGSSRTFNIDLDYQLRNPLGLQRSYLISHEDAVNNPYLKQLFESKEVKDFFSLDNFQCEEFKGVELANSYFNDDTLDGFFITSIWDKAEVAEFLAVLEKDRQDRTFEEAMDLKHSYCNVYLSYTRTDTEGEAYTDSVYFQILPSDTNVIEWIRSKGYNKLLEVTADDVVEIEFRKYEDGIMVGTAEYETMQMEKLNMGIEAVVVDEAVKSTVKPTDDEFAYTKALITDKSQIAEILKTANSNNIDYNNYYEGIIYFKPVSNGHYEKVNLTTDIYFEFSDVPEYIKTQFE